MVARRPDGHEKMFDFRLANPACQPPRSLSAALPFSLSASLPLPVLGCMHSAIRDIKQIHRSFLVRTGVCCGCFLSPVGPPRWPGFFLPLPHTLRTSHVGTGFATAGKGRRRLHPALPCSRHAVDGRFVLTDREHHPDTHIDLSKKKSFDHIAASFFFVLLSSSPSLITHSLSFSHGPSRRPLRVGFQALSRAFVPCPQAVVCPQQPDYPEKCFAVCPQLLFRKKKKSTAVLGTNTELKSPVIRC